MVLVDSAPRQTQLHCELCDEYQSMTNNFFLATATDWCYTRHNAPEHDAASAQLPASSRLHRSATPQLPAEDTSCWF